MLNLRDDRVGPKPPVKLRRAPGTHALMSACTQDIDPTTATTPGTVSSTWEAAGTTKQCQGPDHLMPDLSGEPPPVKGSRGVSQGVVGVLVGVGGVVGVAAPIVPTLVAPCGRMPAKAS